MPRTTKVECPGCPTIRALTFDVLGLIKVVEARGKQGGIPSVVERWGTPEASRNVLAVSANDSEHDPLLVVARKNGLIEVISPLSGDIRVSIDNSGDADQQSQEDNIVGLHIFKRPELGSSSRSRTLLTCSTGGHANMRSFKVPKTGQNTVSDKISKTWDVCNSGNISCSKVDGNEKYVLFGGKGVEVNVWDLDTCTKIWNAKSPPKDSLGIFTPTWFTSATFLNKDDHRKFVAGTNNNQVRLYDISAQRRPVISIDFRETPIKAVTEDLDGNTIYVGNGSGDLASFDIRTGKLLGCFLGQCAGSIRSMARHPELPVLASCGLDSYLRFWDVNTRQLLSARQLDPLSKRDLVCSSFVLAETNGSELRLSRQSRVAQKIEIDSGYTVFLKQPLSNVVFDSHFKDQEAIVLAEKPPSRKARNLIDTSDDEPEDLLVKRKKKSKEHNQTKKTKSKKRSKNTENDEVDEVEESLPAKRTKTSKDDDQTKKQKSKKKSKKIDSDEVFPQESLNDKVEESFLVKEKKRSKEHDQTKKLKSKKKNKKIEGGEC